MLDISQPLLAGAYRHAVERLGSDPAVQVWALQGNFHHLSMYPALHRSTAQPPRRLVTLLGGTLAHLDHEPRFLQQSLLDCEAGDLLLLDVPLASASCHELAAIRRRDLLLGRGVPAPYVAWLEGPLWRHCPQIEEVEFHWDLETQCPVPGSYALHAVATVKSSQRADRRFSLLRLARYEPSQLAQCVRGLGWEELGAFVYAGDQALCLYRKRDDEPGGASRAAGAAAGDAGSASMRRPGSAAGLMALERTSVGEAVGPAPCAPVTHALS